MINDDGFCPRLQSLQVIIDDKWWKNSHLCVIFPPLFHCHYKWWENSHHLSFIMTCNDCNLEQNPDHVPEKKYKYPTISSPPSLYKSLSYHQHLHPTNISLKSLPFDIFLHSDSDSEISPNFPILPLG